MSPIRLKADAVGELLEQCRLVGLPCGEREYRFHPVRRWRFDASWPAHMVALECDGGAFTGGRHVRGAGVRADCVKFSTAAAMGWRVLRILPEHVKSGEALAWVERALAVNQQRGSDV